MRGSPTHQEKRPVVSPETGPESASGWLPLARWLRELLDDVEQLRPVIAALAAELDELDHLGEQRAGSLVEPARLEPSPSGLTGSLGRRYRLRAAPSGLPAHRLPRSRSSRQDLGSPIPRRET